MNDPLANAQLELACRVGSIEAIDEAIEEGADIDFGGGTPLFVAITAGDRETLAALVARGAHLAPFGVGQDDPDAAVDALLALAPRPADDSGAETDIDAKLVRSFDRAIRARGLADPLAKGKADGYPAFADGLRKIAAEERHACVTEFLEIVGPAIGAATPEPAADGGDRGGEGDGGDGGAPPDLATVLEENAEKVRELDERYTAADESPTDLIKDYLKEKKAGNAG